MTNIFIFGCDLRLTAVPFGNYIPVFIFNKKQIEPKLNKYYSAKHVHFMVESVEDLDDQLKKKKSRLSTYLVSGTEKSWYKLFNSWKRAFQISGISFNRDYTPFALKRESTWKKICKKLDLNYDPHEALILYPIDSIKEYKIFTPFYNFAIKQHPLIEPKTPRGKFVKIKTPYNTYMPKLYGSPGFIKGGRKEGLKLLKLSLKNHRSENINIPTTHMSAHLKFGTISPGEAYTAWRNKEKLLRQLYWRDFYIRAFYWRAIKFGDDWQKPAAYQRLYKVTSWNNNLEHFRAWCEGRTGELLVDAGMRQLLETGFMHNRARLVVANYLIKYLRLPWQWGEKFFAKNLIDYSIAVNNGNWLWSSSITFDNAQFLRLMNPRSQLKTHDPKGEYIKKWLPHLKDVPLKHLLNWAKYADPKLHPAPITDLKAEKKFWVRL